MSSKVVIAYEHQPENLSFIYLAGTSGANPTDDDWVPALRDTIDGQRVVTAQLPERRRVWLRDSDGVRSVRPI